MFRFMKLVGFSLRYSLRSRAFTFIVFLNVVISLLIMFLMFMPGALIRSFVSGNISLSELPETLKERLVNFQWANIMIYIPVLSAAFFGSTAIPYEYENGTIYNLISYPVSRFQILMSKISTATILSYVSTLVIVAFQFFFFLLTFGRVPGYDFLLYVSLLFLVTFSDVCFAIAISTFFKKSPYIFLSRDFLSLYL